MEGGMDGWRAGIVEESWAGMGMGMDGMDHSDHSDHTHHTHRAAGQRTG